MQTKSAQWTDSVLADYVGGAPVLAIGPTHGELLLSAASATTSTMAFLVRHTSGLISVALTAERMRELWIPPMSGTLDNGPARDFAMSVDAASGIGTGISAHDRAVTARVLASPDSSHLDIVRPGHVMIREIGRTGSVPLEIGAEAFEAAGIPPAFVSAHLVLDTGELAGPDYCREWAAMREVAYVVRL